MSFALHLRRRRRARGPHRAVLRDVRLPGALPGRVEGGHLPRDPGRRAAASTRRRGSSTTCGPTRRSATTSPPPSPSGSPRWSSGGGRRPSATRCCRSTTGRSPSWCSSARRRCAPRARYTYWPGRAPVPESVAVNVRVRPHAITAHVTVPDGLDVVEGVLAVQGSVLGGWSFHLLGDGRLVLRAQPGRLAALPGRGRRSAALAPGDHTLGVPLPARRPPSCSSTARSSAPAR